MPPMAPDVERGSAWKILNPRCEFRQRLKVAKIICSQYPSTYLVPMLLLCLLLAGSICAVVFNSRSVNLKFRDEATAAATAKAQVLEYSIFSLSSPAFAMGVHVASNPEWSELAKKFPYMAAQLNETLVGWSGIYLLQILSPFGVPMAAYPQNQFTDGWMGQDTFSIINPFTDAIVHGVSSGNYRFITVEVELLGMSGVSVYPVYIKNTTDPDEAWGIPATANCSRVPCYNPKTQVKLWGHVSSVFTVREFLSSDRMSSLSGSGYKWRVTTVLDNHTAVSLAQSIEGTLDDPVCVGIGVKPGEAQNQQEIGRSPVLESGLKSEQWLLCVTREGGWGTIWFIPVMVVAILLSIIFAVLLFFLMISRRHVGMLLAPVLPEQMRKQMAVESGILITTPVGVMDGAGTAAEQILIMTGMLLNGVVPETKDVVLVRSAILQSYDIYQPLDLRRKIAASHLDVDVFQNLMRQLGVKVEDCGADADEDLVPESAYPAGTTSRAQQFKSLQSNLALIINGGSQSTSNRSSCLGPPTFGTRPLPLPPFVTIDQSCSIAQAIQSCSVAHAIHTGHYTSSGHIVLEGPQLQARPSFSASSRSSSSSIKLPVVPRFHNQSSSEVTKPRNQSSFESPQSRPQSSHQMLLLQQAGGAVTQIPVPSPKLLGSQPDKCAHLSPGECLNEAHVREQAYLLRKSVSSRFMMNASEELQDLDERYKDNSQYAIDTVVNPPAVIIEEVEVMLQAACATWDFDAKKLNNATRGHPLSTLAFFLISKSGAVERFDLSPRLLARFLQAVEKGYQDHPYHNKLHAASVLQSLHLILTQGGLVPGFVDPLTLLACHLAATIHDNEHQGLTNDFLNNSSHPLAITYNDRSPMENHHLAASFRLLHRHNFLPKMHKADRDKLRKTMIDLVLGTDMKQHFSVVSQFTATHSNKQSDMRPTIVSSGGTPSDKGEVRRCSPNAKKQMLQLRTGSFPHMSSSCTILPCDENDRITSLQMALKCADLGHMTARLELHLQQVAALEEEFFRQGDTEQSLEMAISPLFDRQKEGVSKSQVGFFDFVVKPLFTSFTSTFLGCQPLMERLMANYHYWIEVEEAKKKRPE